LPSTGGVDGFMSLDKYKRFYWPTFQQLLTALAERDLRTSPRSMAPARPAECGAIHAVAPDSLVGSSGATSLTDPAILSKMLSRILSAVPSLMS
jgi:hypothetical protein